jgi:sorting nexin-1/2
MVGNGGRKYMVYVIKGKDTLGEILVSRRFKEFHLFREILFMRYPGLFIPPIPPK